ncbi:MAG TPA: hypothetical protein PLA68_00075, partial [Panacibacter sp.]|nr:hypothetical protein [Panacibacter sp.]
LDIFLLNRSWKKEIFFPVLYFLFFAGNLFLRYKTIGELAGKYDLGNATKLDLTNLFLNYNRLVARSFLPPMQSTTLFICFYAIIVGFIVFMILKNRKLFAHISVPVIVCCLFVISFAPYIFLGIDTHTTESERYLYLPSIFPCIFFGYSIANSAVSFKRIITIVTLIISYNIIYSFLNSRDYRVASSISKEVYHSIASEAKANDTVYITHLPGQFSGVPVFRLGLKEGLDLLYATDTAKIVVRDTSMFEIHRVYFINLLQQDFKINIQKSPARISNNSVDLTIELDKKYFKTIPYDAHKIF